MTEELRDLLIYGFNTLGSCCGHGKYSKTIIIEFDDKIFEWYSNITIPRTRRFYKTDTQGDYYIPEVDDEKKIY